MAFFGKEGQPSPKQQDQREATSAYATDYHGRRRAGLPMSGAEMFGITWGDTHRIPQAEQPETRRRSPQKTETVFDESAVHARADAFRNWREGIRGVSKSGRRT